MPALKAPTPGYEHGAHDGLNWVPGTVKRIETDHPSLRVPHIGWNDVRVLHENGIYSNHADSMTFYFLHSYVLTPDDRTTISSTCAYGSEFAASIETGNICAVQYHPEKSQKCGLAVLKNFLSTEA